MSGTKRRRVAALGKRAARRALRGLAAAREAVFLPPSVRGVPVHLAADAPTLAPGVPVRLLTWNIQYAAGREHHFFYDGGDAVSVPRADVEQALEGIAEVIRRADPHLVLLQEVDRGARRSAYIDEHARLVAALGYPCHASATYWRAPWVPHPAHEHLGRVDMHLSVLSRYRLGSAIRRTLPAREESWLRRRLGIQRALLEVDVPIAGGPPLTLIDVHLEAFSYADGTLGRQVAALDDRAAALEAQGRAWLAAGDFNSLAPGDDPSRLEPAARALYPAGETDLLPLFARWPEPVGDGWRTDPARWRTYLPFGSPVPDRTLDYLFHGSRVKVIDHRVLTGAHPFSDHLPLLTTLQVA